MLYSTDPKKLNKKEGPREDTWISLRTGTKSHKRQMEGGNFVGEGFWSCSSSDVGRDRRDGQMVM